ncbi:MAG: SPOR domain-containing protein [Bacteroidota bacterium]|nr:SPOR domain-containing protein [Bacteroidota bacterium]
MIRSFYIIAICLPLNLLSQEINIHNKITYENHLEDLIKKYQTIELTNYGISGWRIQIAFASKKSKITEQKIKFINRFPNIIPIYLTYDAPYYKLRIGNFRTKLKAEAIKYKIENYYPGAYLVPEKLPIIDLTY